MTSVDSVLISKIVPMFIDLKFILWLQFYLSSGSPAWWAEHVSRNTINFLYLIWVLQFYLSSGSPAWWAEHESLIFCNTINFLYLIWVSSSIYRLVLQLGGQDKEPQYLGV